MIKRIINSYNLRQPDWRFVGVLFILIFFGFFMLASASAPVGFEKFNDSYYFIKHQLIFGLIPGLIACFLMSMIDYKLWRKYAFSLLIFSIILLILVFIPGIGADFGTSKSWINIFGISLQPAEIVKLTFLLYLASWLESRGRDRVGDLNEGLVPFLTTLGAIMFLMIMQPDIGTMIIIVLISLAVYFVAGAKISHMVYLAAAGLVGIFTLIKIAPYRAARFTVFLHPELDPQGIGYHINQAFLAIGSGGWFGKGFGLSRQKYQYLPEVMGDSIFAVLSEELGFVIATLTILAFIYLLFRGLKIALAANDYFARYVCVGIVFWFGFQAFVNIGAMVGLMPLTGVTLPFISYGGTSLVVNMAAAGLLINISRYIQKEKLV